MVMDERVVMVVGALGYALGLNVPGPGRLESSVARYDGSPCGPRTSQIRSFPFITKAQQLAFDGLAIVTTAAAAIISFNKADIGKAPSLEISGGEECNRSGHEINRAEEKKCPLRLQD